MNRLKSLRQEKGLLQSDIAKIIKKSDRIVGFYESGDRDMGTETLSILADFFNVSIDYLLGKSDVRNSKKIDIKDIDVGFATGYKGLTDANKETLRNIMEGLLAKQELEDKTDDKKE